MTAQSLQGPSAVAQIVTSNLIHKDHTREVIVETPIAIVFNGTTAAVMMATPNDIADFAHGFALTEGYVTDLCQIERFEIAVQPDGIEARFWLIQDRADAISARRRTMAGPVGCGLCGLESLEQVRRPAHKVTQKLPLKPDQITAAMNDLYDWQPLKRRTRSTHAAGLYIPGQGIFAAREDVGRHNALDKLIGACALQAINPLGAVVMTSRISVELVQKCGVLGSPVLIAASGVTSLAIQTAFENNIRLIGFCRVADYEIFC